MIFASVTDFAVDPQAVYNVTELRERTTTVVVCVEQGHQRYQIEIDQPETEARDGLRPVRRGDRITLRGLTRAIECRIKGADLALVRA